MCGRFVGYRKLEQLREAFPIDMVYAEATANFNVAPSQKILAIARVEGLNVLDQYHWGLVPFWAKDISMGYKMINARVETVAAKPSFREALKKRRCLIPADGFYEWQGRKGSKQPVFITPSDQAPFAFAGLWEVWHDKRNPAAPPYRSCTIITRESAGAMQSIHHRMPVILPPDLYHHWIDPANVEPQGLTDMLQTRPVTDLVFHPVSKQVNSVRQNDPSNIVPVQTELPFYGNTG
jgi:putative SOS response-associated peptidase YedK